MGVFRTMGDIGWFIGPIILTFFLPHTSILIGSTPFIIAGVILIGSSFSAYGRRAI